LEFFAGNRIPIGEMSNANALIDNAKNDNSRFCLAKPGEVYLVYLPRGGPAELDLSGTSGSLSVKWFNPRTGGRLVEGSVRSISGGTRVQLPTPPKEPDQDWLLVIRR
jgi:hypothetical protein